MTYKGVQLLTKLENNQQTEPAIKVGGLTGTVAGLVSLVLYFAPNLLTDKQLGVLGVVVAFAIPIITALITRGKVWSPASVQTVVEEAVANAQAEIRSQIPNPTIIPPELTPEEATALLEKHKIDTLVGHLTVLPTTETSGPESFEIK